MKEAKKRAVADWLEGMAAVAVAGHAPERAIRLLAAASAQRDARGTPLPLIDRADVESTLADSRGAVDVGRFETLWEEGRAMTPEQAIEYALSDEAS